MNSFFNTIIEKFIEEETSSDLHLRVNQPVMLRIEGKMIKIDNKKVTENLMNSFIEETFKSRFKDKKQCDLILKEFYNGNKEQDMSINLLDTDFRARVNIFKTNNQNAIVFRKIPKNIPNLEDLGFYNEHIDKIKQVVNKKEGLILVTGQTGSGKSTTLAAILKYINESQNKHIITIEDPIEFEHFSKESLVTHREVGINNDTQNFAQGIKSALREDPDIILIGEMRDSETAETALQAAQTGHIVLVTLHTNNAPETILRLVDMFPGTQTKSIKVSIASSLSLILSQRLVPNIYNNRVLVYEMLTNNNGISNLILEEELKSAQMIDQMTQNMLNDNKMISLNHCLKRRIQEKDDIYKISFEEALEHSYDRETLARLCKKEITKTSNSGWDE